MQSDRILRGRQHLTKGCFANDEDDDDNDGKKLNGYFSQHILLDSL
jgi:hypothetical protein